MLKIIIRRVPMPMGEPAWDIVLKQGDQTITLSCPYGFHDAQRLAEELRDLAMSFSLIEDIKIETEQ